MTKLTTELINQAAQVGDPHYVIGVLSAVLEDEDRLWSTRENAADVLVRYIERNAND